MLTIGIFHSTIRKEEKLIIEAAQKKGIQVKLYDLRELTLDPFNFRPEFHLALERSVSTVKGDYLIQFLESLGIPVINSSALAKCCEDKFLTSLLLKKKNIPTPRFALAFSLSAARQAVEVLGGYPVVAKPPLGSWGRLLARINDEDALESLVEHRESLASAWQKPLYLQEFIRKPGRDIRAFIVGKEVICAIYRISEHWITNTARGAKAINCPLSDELVKICHQVVEAFGEGLLAVDLLETNHGLLVNEINHTMEFRNSEEPTGISISGAIIDYCLKIARDKNLEMTT